MKLKEEDGVEVLMVDQDSPAGKAGLREHDVILTLNGTSVESGPQLRRMIHETPAGRTVTLGISRDGQMQTIKAQLADRRKAMAKGGKGINPPMPPYASRDMVPRRGDAQNRRRSFLHAGRVDDGESDSPIG